MFTRLARTTAIGLCVTTFVVVYNARAADSAATAATTDATTAKRTAAESVDAEIEKTPDSAKAPRSKQAVERMRGILTQVLEHLTEARDEKDVVKLNCVNEKLTAIKGLLKISEQADVTLQEAVARQDTEVSSHEFEKIIIAQRKCEQLLAESEACVGELAVYAGETEVEVILEDVPKNDPADADTREVVVITRPPAASPFQ